jgi:hypothetical protein
VTEFDVPAGTPFADFPFTTTLTVATTAETPPGVYPLVVRGRGEGLERTAELTLEVPAAALVPREARYFAETGFRVEQEPFWDYFQAMGGLDTFGFPVSRTFTFLGCTTQVFQRQLLQRCGGGSVQTMNLLDPDLMPYDQINFSVFPAHDPEVAQRAPAPGTPDYGQAVLAHVRATAPDTFQGLPVRFFATFVSTVPGSDPARDPDRAALLNLQLWGFPTSQPAVDPTNRSFVYQRFQRGIMHYDASTGVTRGILLADHFKSILTGQGLPPDLAAQAATSRFLQQYCPASPQWLCRPREVPATDLTSAFERQ